MFSSSSTGAIALLALVASIGVASSAALANRDNVAIATAALQQVTAHDDFVANDPAAVVLVDDAGNPWVETVIVEAS